MTLSRLMPLGDHSLHITSGVWVRQKGVWSARITSFLVQVQDEDLTAYPAGLDGSVWQGYACSGPVYCPKGRLAEDGTIPDKYPMIELESSESYYRTEQNVIRSDGTLILNKGMVSQGTKLTLDFTVKYGKPSLIVQLDAIQIIEPAHVVRWIKGHLINTLNIAGPRESKFPGGIHSEAYAYLDRVFTLLRDFA